MTADNSLADGKQPLKWGRSLLSGALSILIIVGLVLLVIYGPIGDTLVNRLMEFLNESIEKLYATLILMGVVIASVLACLMVRHRRLAHSILASITSIVLVGVVIVYWELATRGLI